MSSLTLQICEAADTVLTVRYDWYEGDAGWYEGDVGWNEGEIRPDGDAGGEGDGDGAN